MGLLAGFVELEKEKNIPSRKVFFSLSLSGKANYTSFCFQLSTPSNVM